MHSAAFANTPQPPYYAVIFTSQRSDTEHQAYADMADAMVALAGQQPGFLGAESSRGSDGLGITVSYWRDEASIGRWREQSEHRLARDNGRSQWYRQFHVRVARVERDYGFSADD